MARLPGQATRAVRVVGLWVEKNLALPPNGRTLDCLTVGELCPIVPQDNIVVSNKHNWPEFYLGNAWAYPDLKPSMVLCKLFKQISCKLFTIFT